MQNMKTISEYDILRMASHELLNRWLKEFDLQVNAELEGRKDTIAEIKAREYKEQLDEINERLKEIEEKAKAE